MQIVLHSAAFGVVRYQLYKSQTLPSFFFLPVAFNNNARIKSSSMFMSRARMKPSGSKSEDKIF